MLISDPILRLFSSLSLGDRRHVDLHLLLDGGLGLVHLRLALLGLVASPPLVLLRRVRLRAILVVLLLFHVFVLVAIAILLGLFAGLLALIFVIIVVVVLLAVVL